ncbi:hypothetical protein [Ancylobacter polymorphus]|uniref:Uncharacterized protein n=1 Tax=Ancylobacter polymorphus TaxID=223390 RepID=A0ABU0BAY2_9HYPH|nr:hypothetical protein [Ancylobacter polymorphus]MDQ0302983.1 hypothetical protein [Ancylobacter polymorphus]
MARQNVSPANTNGLLAVPAPAAPAQPATAPLIHRDCHGFDDTHLPPPNDKYRYVPVLLPPFGHLAPVPGLKNLPENALKILELQGQGLKIQVVQWQARASQQVRRSAAFPVELSDITRFFDQVQLGI